MSDVIQPDAEMLAAFVNGSVDEELASAIRLWLYTGATETELALYEQLLSERARADALLARWAARPSRAKLLRFLRDIREAGRSLGVAIVEARREVGFAPLSGPPVDELVLEVPAGVAVDLVLRVTDPAHFAVFAVETDGRVHTVARGRAGEKASVALRGIVLEPGDRELDLYAVLDASVEIDEPPPDADEGWLLGLLTAASPGRRVVHKTLRNATEPVAGE